MVAVLDPRGFKLPRVEREKFVQLINLGVDYDRAHGLYSIRNCNNIEKVIDTLAGILGSEVAFLQSCDRCGKSFPCTDCKYQDLCTTRDLPLVCVCPQCLCDKRQFEQYIKKL